MYKEIKTLLKEGKSLLFIGLPCQVAGLKNFIGNKDVDNLYTIDLICHGTPLPNLLMQFLEEQGLKWEDIADIQFREKERFGLTQDGIRVSPLGVMDSYLRSFLKSVDYTENCYSCKYAALERVSDMTLGDALGQMSMTEKGGVSLILCQTEKGTNLLDIADLHLEEVDLAKAVDANHQLRHPSIKHPRRNVFLKELEKGHSFKMATFKAMPKESIKQSLKMGLIKVGALKEFSGGGGYRITVVLKDK